MKSIIILLFCILVCVRSLPKKPFTNVNHKVRYNNLGIINGNSTTIKKHPYLASITVENNIYCAATIIGKRWLVTNAFCFRWVTPSEMTIRVGSTDYFSGGQALKLESVFVPSEYNNDYDYNVALLKTKKPIKFNKKTKAIKMATKEPADGAEVVFSAWGITETGTKGTLLEATLNIVNRTSCQNDYFYPFPTLTKRMLCAYKPHVGPCNDDEGGPLVYKNTLVGYFLGANSCTVSDAPQVYSSVANLQKWIKETMKKN